jgi:hypothetical protein
MTVYLLWRNDHNERSNELLGVYASDDAARIAGNHGAYFGTLEWNKTMTSGRFFTSIVMGVSYSVEPMLVQS